jgi:hypothetical protein
MAAAHGVRPSGLLLVSLFGEISTQTCVSGGDFVAVIPAIVVW